MFTVLPCTAALKPTPWISSFLTKPSLTPLTMLFTSARLRPCSALACAVSLARLTTTLPAATFKVVWLGSSKFNLTFGPSTETFWPFTSTLTFGGITIGCFPIRDITNSLPDIAEQFSAEIFLPGRCARHHAFRRRNHRDSQAAAHARDVGRADVMAQTGPADAFDAFNHALLALILELKLDGLERLAGHGDFRDIAFLLQDVRDALLHFGVRNFHGREQRALRIADPGQHVRNRVNHILFVLVLALVIVLDSITKTRRRTRTNQSLPARLRHTRNQSVQRGFAERQSGTTELPPITASASAERAAVDQAGWLASRGSFASPA